MIEFNDKSDQHIYTIQNKKDILFLEYDSGIIKKGHLELGEKYLVKLKYRNEEIEISKNTYEKIKEFIS